MDLRKLRHAVTLARVLNFTRAAYELNITQSALTRSIQALEKECRFPLFDRRPGMVAVTKAGGDFLRHAEVLLRNEAALRSVVDQASTGEGGHITLGVTPLVARTFLAPVLARRTAQPHFRAEVVIGSSKQILPMILQETIDLGICMGEPAPGGGAPFTSTLLARLSLAVIVRRDHPLTRLARFDAGDLERYPDIRAAHHHVDDSIPPIAGLARTRPPAVTVEDYDVIAQIVSASDAIWVTSPVAARREILAGTLVELPIPWLPKQRISLIACTPSQRTPSPLTSAVLAEFQEIAADLAP